MSVHRSTSLLIGITQANGSIEIFGTLMSNNGCNNTEIESRIPQAKNRVSRK